MAMMEHDPITTFDQWYVERQVDPRDGTLALRRGLAPCAGKIAGMYDEFKREMDKRCENFENWELQADGEVVSRKPDLPNISSGETAGIVRRIARNLVQNTPNVDVVSIFDDSKAPGILSRHILLSKIIGSDNYSNDMQQNLFASTKMALTIGFDCVIPVLTQDAGGSWFTKYDSIHYRDVFPEPGAKDVRDATVVFVRRYLTKGEMIHLIRKQVPGWDHEALRTVLVNYPKPPNREHQSNSHQDKKRHITAEGYEIITMYTSTGEPFLTFQPQMNLLLRIEKNKHPLKWHPVFFLVLEKDNQHPLGKSQVELIYGRQEFQDLMLNGSMKMWYRNINPSIIGYGTVNAIPNLSPGKYTQISNPNAKIEPFEVNTQTLMQAPTIMQSNLGSMITQVGAADQQMAMQSGNGMSATPQGVEAQQAMVDITTNNYQKAIEAFFSRYCSYALTVFFQELKSVKKMTPTAEARLKLLNAGLDEKLFNKDGELEIDFETLAVEYFVRCVPGSLVEMEDEKQLRILNQLFIPLSQAMPALAATQNQEVMQNAAATMQYIIEKEIELSGSNRSKELTTVFQTGRTEQFNEWKGRADKLEGEINTIVGDVVTGQEGTTASIAQLQEQIKVLAQTQQAILEKLGVAKAAPGPEQGNPQQAPQRDERRPANVNGAGAEQARPTQEGVRNGRTSP